jgi:hypothetical protein
VSDIVAKRRARPDVEDAVQLAQQCLAKNFDQFWAVVADDRIEASIFLGGVVPPLRRVGPIAESRRRREISLEEPRGTTGHGPAKMRR